MGRHIRESTTTTKTFADRLSDLVQEKKDSGSNHEQICAELGVATGALSQWMSDVSTANIDALAKIANYFGVSCDYLLGLSDAPTNDPDLAAACDLTGLSKEAVEFFSKIKTGDIQVANKKDAGFLLLELVGYFAQLLSKGSNG